MHDIVVQMLKSGIQGLYAHIEPMKVFEDLSPSIAKIRMQGYPHSIWDLLHHIVIWQNFTIDALEGGHPDWKEVQNAQWLHSEISQNDEEFEMLRDKFENGLQRLEELISSVDLETSLPEFGDSNIAHSILVNIQHNSYHLGQIYTMKKLLIAKD